MGGMTRLKALGLAALCLACVAAWGQASDEEKVNTALTARITGVDKIAHSLALQGAEGERAVVRVDDETTIMSGDKKIGLEGLHKGDWVAVDADRRGDKLVATYVEVVDDPTKTGSP